MVLTAAQAVLFDLDGTLVLTEERNGEVWRVFFDRYGLPLTDERLRQVTGRRGLDALVEICDELPGRFGDRAPQQLSDEVAEIDAATPLGAVRQVPGAAELVRRLDAAGLALALVTSASRPYAELCLDQLGVREAFAALVTAEDVSRGKPDPEGYLAACAALRVAPARAVAFEDSLAGVAAVQAAGARCVAVATTRPRAALVHADLVVADLVLNDDVLAGVLGDLTEAIAPDGPHSAAVGAGERS